MLLVYYVILCSGRLLRFFFLFDPIRHKSRSALLIFILCVTSSEVFFHDARDYRENRFAGLQRRTIETAVCIRYEHARPDDDQKTVCVRAARVGEYRVPEVYKIATSVFFIFY